ncbi:unnamed protein product [Hymenolepis diminuta]|uniref:Uncharacterized protein n=1 Tax=Hymenolepis diminuta TaxID=6216 RepID=A0A564YW60_HYMDI|nr:unnamed protein product [Hymenolepis diminuta]
MSNQPNPVQIPVIDGQAKYAHLLQVIDEMGRDIKPTYVNNKNAAESSRLCGRTRTSYEKLKVFCFL